MSFDLEDKESERDPNRSPASWTERRRREPPLKSESRKHHRILVVDDHEDVRDYLTLLLSLGGHEVESARDGLEALEVAERQRPEIIFLDIQMPKLSGMDVCKRLREKPWAQRTLIYAVTGLSGAEDHLRTRLSGFDGHLVKPVDPEVIASIVARPEPVGRH